MNGPLASSFAHWRACALFGGAVLMGVSVLGSAWGGGDQFPRAYLTAFLFWVGIAVGCLGVALLHQLTGGEWGATVERLAESGARTLPIMALLFIPVLLELPGLYEWARPDAVAADTRLQHKEVYLNAPFFAARALVYFAAWSVTAWLLDRWSVAQDRTADPRFTRRLKRLSAAGALAYGMTVSFAAMDWIMSLEPAWYSTVYGGMVGVGWMLSAFAFVILVVLLTAERPPLARVLSDKIRIDLGNLLMTFVILWTYLSFVQLLIIWVGNVPEEVIWYVRRLRGGWQGIAAYLAVFQFLIPLLVLLFRAAKRSRPVMVTLTAVILFSHWINLMWLVAPAFHPTSFAIHWLDFTTVLGVGGIWVGLFLWLLDKRPLVPLHDPALMEQVVEYAGR